MYELLDQHRMFEPKCLDDFKNLRDLLDHFEVRPTRSYSIFTVVYDWGVALQKYYIDPTKMSV